MKELLERLYAISTTAKNCHYDFREYGDHLLTDVDYLTRINQIDEINEICFLGLGEEAPNQKEILEGSLKFAPELKEDEKENLSLLKGVVKETLVYIQKMDLKVVGVANLVGAIAQDLLKFHGLLYRAGVLDKKDIEFLQNEDKWITVKPNGKENKGRPLLVKDGETPKKAIERAFGSKKKDKSLEDVKKELSKMSSPIVSKREMRHQLGTSKKSEEFLERGKELRDISINILTKETDAKKASYDLERYKEDLKKLQKEIEDEKKSKDKKQEDGTVAGFNVKRESKKAFLLTDGEKEFWVQKRWVNKDNELTDAGKKAYKEAMTIEEKKIAEEELKKIREEGYPIPKKPSYESEKAYGFDFVLDFYDIEKTWKHRMFIPKSVIQKNGNIPTWLMEKKFKEMEEEYRNNGGFTFLHNPFTDEDDDNLENSLKENILCSSILDGEVVFNDMEGLNDASEDYLEEDEYEEEE